MASEEMTGMWVERLNDGTPILRAVPEHPWENRVVFNPGSILLRDHGVIRRLLSSLDTPARVRREVETLGAVCVILYRAQGEPTAGEDYRRSRLGLALLTPGLRLLYRHPEPIMTPAGPYEDLGCEDPRVTEVDGKFVMLYAGYASLDPRRTTGRKKWKINVCMAVSEDLVRWHKLGPVKGTLNDYDNKDAAVFPQPIGGAFYMLHRPMMPDGTMAVRVAKSVSLDGVWEDEGVLFEAVPDHGEGTPRVGAGAPPLTLADDRYLLLYHTAYYRSASECLYTLGVATIRFVEGRFLLEQRYEPVLRPELPWELKGDPLLGVNNVVFVCGGHIHGGYLYFPYGGADTVILGGRLSLDSL